MTRTIHSASEAQTMALAAALGRRLSSGAVVCLYGELGAGKTRFVQGLAAGIGVDPNTVSSPTFVICHEYRGAALRLAHIDAYRLHSVDELESIGWDELLGAPDTIIAVEWAARIAEALPANRLDVRMDHEGPTQRCVTLEGQGTAARHEEQLDDAIRS